MDLSEGPKCVQLPIPHPPRDVFTTPELMALKDMIPKVNELHEFLKFAPYAWPDGEEHDPGLLRHDLTSSDKISCTKWRGQYFVTGTDVVRILLFLFNQSGRTVTNAKKFEEGVFSDLRNLKPGTNALLEEPRSPFLEYLFKHGCIRTQKKQKVFFWFSVDHQRLFHDALQREFKRESELAFKQQLKFNPGMMVMGPVMQSPMMMNPMAAQVMMQQQQQQQIPMPQIIPNQSQSGMATPNQPSMQTFANHQRRGKSMSSMDFMQPGMDMNLNLSMSYENQRAQSTLHPTPQRIISFDGNNSAPIPNSPSTRGTFDFTSQHQDQLSSPLIEVHDDDNTLLKAGPPSSGTNMDDNLMEEQPMFDFALGKPEEMFGSDFWSLKDPLVFEESANDPHISGQGINPNHF